MVAGTPARITVTLGAGADVGNRFRIFMHSTSIYNYVWGRFDPPARFIVGIRIGLVAIAIGVIAVVSSFNHPAPRTTNTDTIADATSVSVQAASPPGPRSLASATVTPVSATTSAQSRVQEPTMESSRSSDYFQPATPSPTSVSPTPGRVAALLDPVPVPSPTSVSPTPGSAAASPDPVPVPNPTSVSPIPGRVAALPDPVPATIAAPVLEASDKPAAGRIATLHPAVEVFEAPDKPAAGSDKIWHRKKSVKKRASSRIAALYPADEVFEAPDEPAAGSDKIWHRKKSEKERARSIKHIAALYPADEVFEAPDKPAAGSDKIWQRNRSHSPSPFDKIGRIMTGSAENMRLDYSTNDSMGNFGHNRSRGAGF